MENEKQEQKPPPDFVLGFRLAGSGRGLGGASRPGGKPKNIFGNDSDDEKDHMKFLKNRVKQGHGSIMLGRNTFKPPKIGEPKPIEQIRREHALKDESEIPKQQVKRLADTQWPDDTQWDDDIDYDPIVSPHKKQKIADNDTGYELDFATSPKNTKFVEKSYINIQKTNLTDKYAISSNKSSKLCRTPEQSPDTSFDEEEEFDPPSPIITTRYAAREKMSGTKFGGFSSGICTHVTTDTSVINAACEKLDDTGFASGLGTQKNTDYSSAEFGGFSGGFGKRCSTPKNIDPIKTLGPLELSPNRESTVFTPGEIKMIIEQLTKSKEYIDQRKKAEPDKKPRLGCLYLQKKDKSRKSMKLSDMSISQTKGGKEDLLILTYYSKKEILQKQIKCLDSGNLHCDENGEIRIEHFQIALQARD